MRIGILGNMNNNAVNLAHYLTDAGYDCELLLYINEANHFLPDSDGYESPPFNIKYLSWGRYIDLWLKSGRQIRKDIIDYDFLIGSRLAPSFVRKAGLSLDIFMPTGGDIWTVPVFAGWSPKNLLKFLLVSRRQKAGIQGSAAIFFDRTNVETERKIAPVVQGVTRYEHPITCLYYPEFEGDYLQRRIAASGLIDKFRNIRQNSDIFLVHHVKHLWLADSVARFDVLQEKGNDRILHALKLFRSWYPDVSVTVLMCEYGVDYRETQRLAVELGVDNCIEWIALTPRKELLLAIHLADAVIGELARSWFSYGVVLEAMTMQKPVIHNRDDDFFEGCDLYPMIHADSAESVARAIERIHNLPREAEDIGRKSGRWLRDVAIGNAISDITSLIERKRLCSSDG
jgi:glycosyltransferase involved in cell wall biosynthesis